MAVKNMAASVLTRLKQQAKSEGISFQTCLQLFAQEEFLRKLSLSTYVENLILKGGTLIVTLQRRARAKACRFTRLERTSSSRVGLRYLVLTTVLSSSTMEIWTS